MLALGLLVAGMASPGVAKKKKPKAKPVKTVLYLDGDMDVAEAEDPLLFQKLSPTKPDGATPKSKQITNYVAWPEHRVLRGTACSRCTWVLSPAPS